MLVRTDCQSRSSFGSKTGLALQSLGTRTMCRGAGEDDEVAVGVPNPDLLLERVRVRVHVADYRSAAGAHRLYGGLEVRNLEPEQDAVPERLVAIREAPVVILDLDVMELQDDLAVLDDLLVLVPAVAALGTEHPEVEPPRGGDVPDDHHRLRPDPRRHGAILGG
jgi:hypothetical protein